MTTPAPYSYLHEIWDNGYARRTLFLKPCNWESVKGRYSVQPGIIKLNRKIKSKRIPFFLRIFKLCCRELGSSVKVNIAIVKTNHYFNINK